ncbi:hypothetical protein ENSA7_38560 [Enhygromyxa salina]|uniref:Uncharacterized protein n=1 Tax=Enhygromyxa salina TaxID=215803 RepID=A0A2S9YN73_9BACT|nr:hypothetical protein ENSA7_38560 [Enhygromyxa salina]
MSAVLVTTAEIQLLLPLPILITSKIAALTR